VINCKSDLVNVIAKNINEMLIFSDVVLSSEQIENIKDEINNGLYDYVLVKGGYVLDK